MIIVSQTALSFNCILEYIFRNFTQRICAESLKVRFVQASRASVCTASSLRMTEARSCR
ncbi:MAG: hypothetical protein IKM00_07535 [Clostridia bacterium]|nr:hypothetical protein [Clostridia bacterium]